MHAAGRTEKCFNEGETVTYQCTVPAVVGVLDWNGVGFDCPNSNTISNNVLPLQTATCPLREIPVGKCGPYFGNLTCTDDEQHLISVLQFKSDYSIMNGGNISCLLNTNETETFEVTIGGKFILFWFLLLALNLLF